MKNWKTFKCEFAMFSISWGNGCERIDCLTELLGAGDSSRKERKLL